MNARRKESRPRSKKYASVIEQLQRQRGVRDLARRFLIACEDDKSAPRYFEAMKRHFNLSAASIVIVGSGGNTQPIQVVNEAIKRQETAATTESGTIPFDEVWCVIDGDYEEKIVNARSRADANNIHLAVTTKCFEYWLLLHFEECDQPAHDCRELESKLRKHLPGYEKGKCDFRAVVPNVKTASDRAKKLRKRGIELGTLPENQNPCSELYRLVEAILKAQ